MVRADAQAGSRWYTWVRVDRRVARRGSLPAAPGSGPGSRRVVRQSGGTGRGCRRRVGLRGPANSREGPGTWLPDGSALFPGTRFGRGSSRNSNSGVQVELHPEAQAESSSRHCLSAGGCARQTATIVLVVEACGTAGSGVRRAGRLSSPCTSAAKLFIATPRPTRSGGEVDVVGVLGARRVRRLVAADATPADPHLDADRWPPL